MNKNNKGIFSFHTVTSQSLNVDDDFNDSQNSEKEKVVFSEVNNNKNKENNKGENIEIATVNQENENKSNNQEINLNSNKKKKICRICYLEEENNHLNPLIKPCKCSGSMKYIHYECLLHWLRTKLIITKRPIIDNGFFDIYKLDLIECELCKNHLLNYIKHNNKIYSLIDYHRLDKQIDKLLSKKEKSKLKNENNYIIFDDILPGRSGNLCRYLVKFNPDGILKIGRGLDNQLILNDISVSRTHCLISLDQSYNLILEDCNSKFGSLVLIQAEEIEILKGKTLTIQAGTNYFSFKLILPKKNFFSCCSAEEIDEKNDYEKINSLWVKYDKNNEILNESLSGEESGDENKEIKSNVDLIVNKDNANSVCSRSENKKRNEQKELIDNESELDLNNKNKNKNLINIEVDKKENINTNINTNNYNNIDSGLNISTLKINNAVNISQIENYMDEIREENKSEIDKNSDKRSNEKNKSINKENENENIKSNTSSVKIIDESGEKESSNNH